MVVRVTRREQARRGRGATLRALRAIGDVPVAVALLFACSLASPRAPLVYHHHAGGEHEHVHADAALLALFGFGDAAAHRSPHAPDPRPAYARDTGVAGGHVHHQDSYRAAVVPAVAFVAVAAPLAPLTPVLIARASTRATCTASARAPPLSVV
jgi:hypothetical protein